MATQELLPKVPNRTDVFDQADVDALLAREIEQGNFPIVSVPLEHAEAVRTEGLKPRGSLVGQERIRAKIGKPYMPEGEERVCFMIKKPVDAFRPERTGPDNDFHGVVTVLGSVDKSDLEEIPCGTNSTN